MTERDVLISAVVALWASVVALAAYIKYLHDKHAKQQKETIEKVVSEIAKSSAVMEQNTKLYDKVFHYIEKATRR